MISAVIYAEFSNCIMYLSPTSIGVQDNCVLLCIIPMFVVIVTVECRLFAYFLLIRERLKVINELINVYREKLKNSPHIEDDLIIKNKLFFISEFMQPPKTLLKMPPKISSLTVYWNFLKSLFDCRIGDTKVHCRSDTNSINFVEHIMIIKAIYSKLYDISDKINLAYGMQIISIIAVQFITLTTLLYYCSMKLVR